MCTTLNHLGLQYVKRWYKTLHEENMIDARTKVLQKDEKSAEAWIMFCLYQNDKSAGFWRASLLYSNFAQLKNYSLVVSSSFLLSFIYCQWGRNQINLAQVCSGPCLKNSKLCILWYCCKEIFGLELNCVSSIHLITSQWITVQFTIPLQT